MVASGQQNKHESRRMFIVENRNLVTKREGSYRVTTSKVHYRLIVNVCCSDL
jgi:hypothetical protein